MSGSVWHGSNNKLKVITNFSEKSSVGKFYRSITSSLGFLINRHEGKVTGLAAFGNSKIYYKQLEKFYILQLMVRVLKYIQLQEIIFQKKIVSEIYHY